MKHKEFLIENLEFQRNIQIVTMNRNEPKKDKRGLGSLGNKVTDEILIQENENRARQRASSQELIEKLDYLIEYFKKN
jgi:hypothetical protein